jgi:exonuclease SbcD
MASFRFLHCADLHIDSPLRGLESDQDAPTERIRNATREAVVNLVSYAIDERVAFVLAAGDLYDGDWPDWRTGQFLIAQIGRLNRAGIPFIAIRGNHDADSVITRHLAIPEPSTLITPGPCKTVQLDAFNVSIHGRSYAQPKVTEDLAASYPPPTHGRLNIGLLHTALEGRPGHAPYAPCTLQQLRDHGYGYWALGHIHRREVLCTDPWIVFPGNLQGRDIGETGPKGAMLVTVVNDQVERVEPQMFDTVRWAVVPVELPHDADEDTAMALTRSKLLNAVKDAEGRLLAARITLSGACPAHAAFSRDIGAVREKVRAEALGCVGPDALWVESVKIETRPQLDIRGLRERSDAVGALVRAIETTTTDELRPAIESYCRAMLDRAGGLRADLGGKDGHPSVAAAEGEVPDALIERARNLLLARFAES